MLLLIQRALTDCLRVATHRVTGRRVPTGADDDADESHDEVEEDENEVGVKPSTNERANPSPFARDDK